jgi:predicted urease superfamily metal-dependent hydrolase
MEGCDCECRAKTEKVELVVQMVVRHKDGRAERLTRTLLLDPEQFTTNETQQYEKTFSDGKVVDIRKVGKPHFTASGVIIGSEMSKEVIY